MRPQKRMRAGTINWVFFFIWPKTRFIFPAKHMPWEFWCHNSVTNNSQQLSCVQLLWNIRCENSLVTSKYDLHEPGFTRGKLPCPFKSEVQDLWTYDSSYTKHKIIITIYNLDLQSFIISGMSSVQSFCWPLSESWKCALLFIFTLRLWIPYNRLPYWYIWEEFKNSYVTKRSLGNLTFYLAAF